MAKTKKSTAKASVAQKNAKATRRATTRKGTAGKDATKAHISKKTTTKSTDKRATKKSSRSTPASKKPKADQTVPIDRRRAADRRTDDGDRRKQQKPVAVERRKLERRAKVSRRRQIDPTTCERDYTADELDFMSALDEYKRTSGRMFPTCSEILEVIRGLGYRKTSSVEEDTSSTTVEQATDVSSKDVGGSLPSPSLGEQATVTPPVDTVTS